MEDYRHESAPAGAFYRLRPRWTVRPGLSRAGSLWIAKSLKLGREVRFRRGIDHAHWLLIETDPEVASFCEEPVWTDGQDGSPLADLCVRRGDGATEFLRVERSERGDAVARRALKGTFGAAVSFRSMTAAEILADPVLLDNASAGDWPRLNAATRACAGLGGAGLRNCSREARLGWANCWTSSARS